jgi:iron complex outermembrane receptor protein
MNFKKIIPFVVSICLICSKVSAQQTKLLISKTDTLKTIEEVIVIANQAKINGSNVNTLSENQINALNTGRDIPILLQQLPNVITTSDAGNGIGYTGIRVRGSDATRTNVTINGVPINDAESQGTFWVNMPDLASSVANITVQRGIGSSMSGAGAFGASVNIQTSNSNTNEFNLSYGSFNSRKFTAKFSSPNYQFKSKHILNFSGRVSNIASDGFIDRAKSDLWSYYASVNYTNGKSSLKLLVFGGTEKTYQAWWGIPIEKFNLGKSNSPSDSLALIDHYYRNAGVGYIYQNSQDSANLFNSKSNTYNYYKYNNETDNYQQYHAHLYFNHQINDQSIINTTLYYTHGEGYFEQFRFSDKLSKYNLPNITTGDTGLIAIMTQSDLVRQRWLKNDLIGANMNYFVNKKNQQFTIGVSANQYFGQHYGFVKQVFSANNQYTNNNLPKQYYKAIGNKTDLSLFLKYNQNISQKFSYFLDVQGRKVIHKGNGTDNDLVPIDFNGNFSFFNPKAGFSYLSQQSFQRKNMTSVFVNHEFSGSIGMGNKEPSRSDFTDNKGGVIPKPEQMVDYELGYEINVKSENKSVFQKHQLINFKINGYYMNYKDQLVLSGALNDVGTALRINVPQSYRAGVELENMTNIFNSDRIKFNGKYSFQLAFIGNIAFSQNRITNSPATWFDYGTNESVDTIYQNAPIAYSPSEVSSYGINYTMNFFQKAQISSENPEKIVHHMGGQLTVQFVRKTVGKQYLDNTGTDSRSIGAYHFEEITIGYRHLIKGQQIHIKIQGNNLNNQYYANNGYTWGYMYNRAITQEVFVFPSAMRNWNVSLGYVF